MFKAFKNNLTISLAFLAILIVPFLAYAADGLVPCGNQYDATTGKILNPCTLCHLYQLTQKIIHFLMFTIAPTLGVLVISWGGFKILIAGGDPGAKQAGYKAITTAAVGLLIVFSAWIVINEFLLFFSSQKGGGTATILSNPWTEVNCNLNPAPIVIPPTALAGAWGDDSLIRASLLPVIVKSPSCATIGQIGCTSVFGLMEDVVLKIKALKTSCGASCVVTITGGTEYWLHQTHNNNRNVDLAKDGVLDAYITKSGPASITSCGVSTDPHYQVGADIYVDEPNRDANGNITGTGRHWHVCY
ncbi:hypothetical protein HY249_01370 [Candidatus Azambacteria bacterium]|nr:hypothetical protein [Candidatus Azambacteria bacterium]